MVYYIFEDNPDKGISKLFKLAYPESVANRIIFAKGRGNLEHQARKYLKDTTNKVVVFVDLVPDNPSTAYTVKILLRLYKEKKYTNRIVVIPIPCMEYFLIKSLSNSALVVKRQSIQVCIELEDYRNDSILSNRIASGVGISFEKYCKLLVNSAFKQCVKDKHKVDGVTYKELYVTTDCECDTPIKDSVCGEASLEGKAHSLIQQFPVFPCGSTLHIKLSSYKIFEALTKSRELIDNYNDWVDNYRSLGYNGLGEKL